MSLGEGQPSLFDLCDLWCQVWAGFMIERPLQTAENLYEDLEFLDRLKSHMIGIGSLDYLFHNHTHYSIIMGSVQVI
jgi:biotin synthase